MNHCGGRGECDVEPLPRPKHPPGISKRPTLAPYVKDPARLRAYADRLEAWIEHMENVIAFACACRCPWCPDCIDSIAGLLPEAGAKVELAARARDEHARRRRG